MRVDGGGDPRSRGEVGMLHVGEYGLERAQGFVVIATNRRLLSFRQAHVAALP
jgi:hypothetical protein